MDENEVLKLPHEHLLDKYNLDKSALSDDTQQLITEVGKIQNAIKNTYRRSGKVNLTAKTEQKLKSFDRYICDGIYDFLEEQEEAQQQSDQMKAKEQGFRQENPPPTETDSQETDEEENDTSDESTGLGVGFWDW